MDDPFTRQMIADVIAQCDLHDAMCARSEARLAQLKTRQSDMAEVVYKTYEPQPMQQQAVAATLDDETQAKWDRWCDAHIWKMLEGPYKEAVAKFVSDYVYQRLTDETTKLREEIATLRADVAILRGIIQSNNVTPIKSDRDAA
jgi:hypothetical protein